MAVFYEGDSWDNLEQNLVRSPGGNYISQFMKSKETKKQYTFHFLADKMFATTFLDTFCELNPESDTIKAVWHK